jgi:hypothetical protein
MTAPEPEPAPGKSPGWPAWGMLALAVAGAPYMLYLAVRGWWRKRRGQPGTPVKGSRP